jgi:hypothetical protein
MYHPSKPLMIVLGLMTAACQRESTPARTDAPDIAALEEQNRMNNARIAEEQRQKEEQEASAITAILAADAQAGKLGTTRQTAGAMEAISLTAAPVDFSEAYVIHRQAWEDLAEIVDQAAYLNSQAATDEAWKQWWIETFRGTDGTPVSDLEAAKARIQERRREANERIRTSFQTVERLAVRYRAQLPPEESVAGNTTGM